MPVGCQTSDAEGTSPTSTGAGAGAVDRRAGRVSRSSTRLFHWPQVGQRPCHFGATAPHSAQTWRTRVGRAAGGGKAVMGAG